MGVSNTVWGPPRDATNDAIYNLNMQEWCHISDYIRISLTGAVDNTIWFLLISVSINLVLLAHNTCNGEIKFIPYFTDFN